MVPGVPRVESGNWGWECDSLCYHVLTLREQHNLQIAVFCEEILGSSHIQRCQSYSQRVVLQIILLENLTNKKSSGQ